MGLVFYYLLVFLSGLFFGSFYNLVSDRVIKGKSIVFGGSNCEYCGARLKLKDLIPLISFAKTRGHCSYCGKKLSWVYPISELMTGSAFVLAMHLSKFFEITQVANVVYFVYLIIVFSFYIILFLSDSKYYLIPDKVVFPAITFVLLYKLSSVSYYVFIIRKGLMQNPLGKYLSQTGYIRTQLVWLLKSLGLDILSAICIGLFFVSLIYLSRWIFHKEGMGGGDVTLGILVGLVNEFPKNVLAIFLGFVFGSLFSLVLVGLKRKSIKDHIPFGPFLILGSLTAITFGDTILWWYLNILR